MNLEAKIESAIEVKMIELTEQAELRHQIAIAKMRVELHKSDKPKPLWNDLVSQSQTIDKQVDGVVVDLRKLQKLTNELQLKTEQDELAKRKNCAIIQGFVEVSGSNSEERQ